MQETLVKVLAAANRIEPGMLEPYAITTARNVIASMWRSQDRSGATSTAWSRWTSGEAPDERLLQEEERAAISAALERLSEREQQTLLAHEVSGQDTRSLATELDSSAGAVAAQLNRTRARLRVEYLLALDDVEPPTDRCRAVLWPSPAGTGAASARSMPVGTCWSVSLCAELSEPLLERRPAGDNEVTDPDPARCRHRAGAEERPGAGVAGSSSPAPT